MGVAFVQRHSALPLLLHMYFIFDKVITGTRVHTVEGTDETELLPLIVTVTVLWPVCIIVSGTLLIDVIVYCCRK